MNLPIKPEDILIKTQPTPNPYAVKFIVNQPLKQDGKATFASPHEAENLPLVYDLFLIDGVRQIYLFENTMTITHTGELEIGDLAEQVIAVVSRLVCRQLVFPHREPQLEQARLELPPQPVVARILACWQECFQALGRSVYQVQQTQLGCIR